MDKLDRYSLLFMLIGLWLNGCMGDLAKVSGTIFFMIGAIVFFSND